MGLYLNPRYCKNEASENVILQTPIQGIASKKKPPWDCWGFILLDQYHVCFLSVLHYNYGYSKMKPLIHYITKTACQVVEYCSISRCSSLSKPAPRIQMTRAILKYIDRKFHPETRRLRAYSHTHTHKKKQLSNHTGSSPTTAAVRADGKWTPFWLSRVHTSCELLCKDKGSQSCGDSSHVFTSRRRKQVLASRPHRELWSCGCVSRDSQAGVSVSAGGGGQNNPIVTQAI